MPRAPRSRLAVLCLLALACASTDGPSQQAPPRPDRTRVTLESVHAVGPYLEAIVVGARGRFRFFFPASPDCTALIREGGEARYLRDGPFGVVRNDAGVRCEPVGVADLAPWRDLQQRRRSRFLMPRELAEFRPLHEGGEQLLVRGRFPLALELRWPDPMDAVAVLPGSAACRALVAERRATLEFHATGPEVLLLEGDSGLCPITGLALPLDVD